MMHYGKNDLIIIILIIIKIKNAVNDFALLKTESTNKCIAKDIR